ncbi:tetratricopeptide repeat-containing sensor histidine kinase [Chitinophaga nivalis]|uniref:ATP-binding protein n=1 Tax=Chitinophaga nivalis TaxID=2991709 RepID=A0ABT3ISB6_9BACT|nr:ATP-binding protein [Chitinophaga nivalis]MCW3463457.1 ATP-binding protein [Chitinophaga nivalis]MCW3486853.1 ATP-binding protein [Chitinophaga nivalis]
MKTLLILLIVTTCLFACRQQHVPVLVTQEPDYEKAQSFLHIKNDSAFYYYNKVVGTLVDSIQIAQVYNLMAALQADAGDYYGSQENLLMSLRYLNEQNERHVYCLSSDYNELGNTSLNLKNYDAAIHYYDLALKYARNDTLKQTLLNNKGLVYQKEGNYMQAIAIYDSIIHKKNLDPMGYARVLSNLARTKWLRNTGYRAAPELLTALQIRIQEKDDWGQNASYAHLSDYYMATHPDSALLYAGKMYNVARQLNSPGDEAEALQKLIQLAPAHTVKPYFTRYQYLNDSIQTARNKDKNQFALIRYDVAKNKMENLQLQKENADKKVQIIQQRILIYGVILLMVAGLFTAIGWYRKRKQRIIREEKLKNSRKVHDVVANGLHRIMSELQYQPVIEKEKLLDKIDNLYNKSRDLSYEKPPVYEEGFQTEIIQLLASFQTDAIHIMTVGNNEHLWENIADDTKEHVKLILQELLVNMKKHSDARNVAVRFEQTDGQIFMQYTDDGVGLPAEHTPGNGLKNTVSRIKNMNGRITFDSDPKKGLKVRISFPIVYIP